MQIFTPASIEADEKAVEQLRVCLKDERAVDGALMADHHLGYSMPIGGVIRYDGAISPSGVGKDIACGNKAVLTGLLAADIEGDMLSIMKEVQQRVAFGMGRSNDTPLDHPLFEHHSGTLDALDRLAGKRAALSQRARAQLGTVGSGNHYVDILADSEERVWVANHFGSRGLGNTIATGFLNLAAGRDFDARGAESELPTVLAIDTDLGQAYLAAMGLAGDYAYAGRDYVAEQVLAILGTTALLEVHNHHNFAWEEDGLWVVRKGATPLTSALAFIGGSMGDGAVIVRGRTEEVLNKTGFARADGEPEFLESVVDVGALNSAPHGSGRVMSRTKAAGKFMKVADETTGRKRRVRDASTGIVNWPAVRAGLHERGIVVLGSGADEAPEVYKPLDAVLAAHPNIEVIHRLRPLGVVMAGDDVYDPYKD